MENGEIKEYTLMTRTKEEAEKLTRLKDLKYLGKGEYHHSGEQY